MYPAVMQLTSLAASKVAERFGSRAATAAGAVVTALGFLLSSWATHLVMLYVSFGGIVGCGAALLTISSAPTAGQYFAPSRRRLAMGVASSGAGLGTAVLAPVFYHLHHVHGWRWAFRAVAFVSLVANAAAAYVMVPRHSLAKPVDGPPMAARMPFTGRFFKDPVYRCLLVAVPLLCEWRPASLHVV